MRVTAAALSVLFLCTATAAFAGRRVEEFKPATPEELAMRDTAIEPGSSAVILKWVRHRDDQEGFESEYMRLKILTAEGKKYGDVEIPYYSRYWSIKEIYARTIHPDGSIVNFDGKVYDKLLMRSGRTRIMAKTFSLPDVQPGCIIEYF